MNNSSNKTTSRLFTAIITATILLCCAQSSLAIDRRQEIVDSHEGCIISPSEMQSLTQMADTVYLIYDRFDVMIDSSFWDHDSIRIVEFFDQFQPRLIQVEATTGWSSELLTGEKLRVFLRPTTGCYGGGGSASSIVLFFSDPLYKSGCLQSDGIGELGGNWRYMSVAIHEAIHAINPNAIWYRRWLTEGFGRYYQYNALVTSGDISQETADTKLYNEGSNYFSWSSYLANDYHDTTPDSNEIQESPGYSLTGWMFTMMRDSLGLDWSVFHEMMHQNRETIGQALTFFATSWYYVDMVVIDLFAKATGKTFAEMKDIWQYDGPSGPGWGVRQWVDRDWYPDYTPDVTPTPDSVVNGMPFNITALVSNDGESPGELATYLTTDSVLVSVRFYVDASLNDEQFVWLDSLTDTTLTSSATLSLDGEYTITVVVDEDDIKLETNDSNNVSTTIVHVFTPCCDVAGDADNNGSLTIGDVTFLIARIFSGGPAPVCQDKADADGSNSISIGDVTYLIARIFSGGPAPICGTTGI